MARKRMLAPEFFTSSTMNALPVEATFTFAGIWCWADDYGRGEDDETMVKAAVWPRRRKFTERVVRSHMDALITAGVLCAYSVNGIRLVHVVSWAEHQKISHPTRSKVAPCRDHHPEAWEPFVKSTDSVLHKFRNGSGAVPEYVRRAS